MRIAFVTEMPFFGKLPKEFKDFRTVESWIYGFGAVNVPFNKLDKVSSADFDLFIIIIPKGHAEVCSIILEKLPMKQTVVLQEGPCYYFQDLPSEQVLVYEKLLRDCKMILCHNERDCSYFRQFNKTCLRLPTCCDTQLSFKRDKRDKVALSFGSQCSWYNGQTSYRILKDSGFEIVCPRMGRFKKDEKLECDVKNIGVFDYMPWYTFMSAIRNVGLACHMMPTMAASSYAIICAMLSIPCICGPSDIAKDLFPYTTTSDPYDYEMGSIMVKKLVGDKDFYDKVVDHAVRNVGKYDFRVVCPSMIKKFERVLGEVTNERNKKI